MDVTLETLRGLWRRSLIEWPDGRRNRVDEVHWLQGPRFYADLRQRPARPAFDGVTCLRDVRPEHLDWLASQQGFAGELHEAGGVFEWRRALDFQPASGTPDQGRLRFEGDILRETGVNLPYLEEWRRRPTAALPAHAVALRDPAEGRRGFLVRVGEVFMYARARAIALPPGPPLSEHVAGAPSLRRAQDLLDCEISQGRIHDREWIIERSSLPFREGCALQPRWAPGILRTADLRAEGGVIEREWGIIAGDWS
ncbi:MAG TPA: hypothetical protein VKT70_09375 [Stellaceae bacterium]|nr:hypothetical protein [Stellaceae bacterium]